MPKPPGIAAQDAYPIRDAPNASGIDSSAIAAQAYYPDDEKLVLTFRGSGKSYAYYGVSRQRYTAFMDAESKGKYFNAAIRNNYNFRRLG